MFNLHLNNLAHKRELNELYISIVIRSFALGIIGLFVPLYLFKELEFTLNQVMYFYMMFVFSFLFFTPIAAKTVGKIGYKHTILLSIPLLISFFGMLYGLEYFEINYFFIAFIGGIADALFWMAFHLDFLNSSDKKHRGEEVGVWYSLSLMISVVAPFIGGVLLTYVDGFNFLFIIVGLLLFMSTIPLFLTKDGGKKVKFDSSSLIKNFKLKDFLIFVSYGFRHYAEVLLWPLFIFLILKNYFNLGSMASVVYLISGVFVYISGKLCRKHGKCILKWGSIICSMSWFFRYFVKSAMEIFLVSSIGNISFAVLDVPLSAEVYNRSKGVEYLIWREIGLCLGRALLITTVLVTGNFLTGFLLTGIGSFFWMFF